MRYFLIPETVHDDDLKQGTIDNAINAVTPDSQHNREHSTHEGAGNIDYGYEFEIKLLGLEREEHLAKRGDNQLKAYKWDNLIQL